MRSHNPPLEMSILLRGLLPLLVAGCGTEPSDCHPCRTTAVVTVAVRDTEGAPVPGVLVRLRTYLFTCGENLRGGTGDQATDATGQRRTLASSLDSPHVVRCIRVTVSEREPPNSVLAEQDFPVQLEFRVHDDTPRDSVRVEIIVP